MIGWIVGIIYILIGIAYVVIEELAGIFDLVLDNIIIEQLDFYDVEMEFSIVQYWIIKISMMFGSFLLWPIEIIVWIIDCCNKNHKN